MSTAIVFVLIALVMMVSFAYFAMRRPKSFAEFNQAHAAIQALDVQAFRNLVDPEEEAFLRTSLPAADYRRIKRERTRAALAYVRELSTASLQFARFGDAARRSADPAIAESGRQIANSAIALRLGALHATVRLTASAAFPVFDASPVRSLVDRYEQASALLEGHTGPQSARSQAS